MNCSLSGEVPQEPVVSRLSGHVFERRLIIKHLETASTCPITGADMTAEDLITVKSSRTVPPRDITATSVPGIMSLLQKEWDATMLESFTLKQNIQTLRSELSQALYQHDAACRVIARLVKERDQALAALQGGASASAPVSQGPTNVVPGNVLAAMKAKEAELKPGRKKRTKPATLASLAELGASKVISTHTPHSASKPGITCVAIHSQNQNAVATGGVDKVVKVFDREVQKLVGTATGHTKKITSVAWHPTQNVVFSGSEDATVRGYALGEQKDYVEKIKFSLPKGAVTDLAVHATGTYVASSSSDGIWRLHDCAAATTVTEVADEAAKGKGLTSLAFHPDGLLLAAGSGAGSITIWDMKIASAAQRVLTDHEGPVSSLSFSENGINMVSGSHDGTVRLWDLRRGVSCVKTHQLGGAVNSVRFNHSGTFIACGGHKTHLLHTKKWLVVNTFEENKGSPVMGVALTNDARVLASVGMDRTLRFYGI